VVFFSVVDVVMVMAGSVKEGIVVESKEVAVEEDLSPEEEPLLTFVVVVVEMIMDESNCRPFLGRMVVVVALYFVGDAPSSEDDAIEEASSILINSSISNSDKS
jgi:hypothetical protein